MASVVNEIISKIKYKNELKKVKEKLFILTYNKQRHMKYYNFAKKQYLKYYNSIGKNDESMKDKYYAYYFARKKLLDLNHKIYELSTKYKLKKYMLRPEEIYELKKEMPYLLKGKINTLNMVPINNTNELVFNK